MGRTRGIHVDLSLSPDNMVKELKELVPEAFKTEESSALISSPIAPTSSLLLDTAPQLGSVTLHPSFTSAATKPARSSSQPPLPDQEQPPVAIGTAAKAGLPLQLKNTVEQQASGVASPSLHGDSGQPPSNSSTEGTKED